jgi:hypothetical protein
VPLVFFWVPKSEYHNRGTPAGTIGTWVGSLGSGGFSTRSRPEGLHTPPDFWRCPAGQHYRDITYRRGNIEKSDHSVGFLGRDFPDIGRCGVVPKGFPRVYHGGGAGVGRSFEENIIIKMKKYQSNWGGRSSEEEEGGRIPKIKLLRCVGLGAFSCTPTDLLFPGSGARLSRRRHRLDVRGGGGGVLRRARGGRPPPGRGRGIRGRDR